MGLRTGLPGIIRTALITFAIILCEAAATAQQPKVLAPHRPMPPKVAKP